MIYVRPDPCHLHKAFLDDRRFSHSRNQLQTRKLFGEHVIQTKKLDSHNRFLKKKIKLPDTLSSLVFRTVLSKNVQSHRLEIHMAFHGQPQKHADMYPLLRLARFTARLKHYIMLLFPTL